MLRNPPRNQGLLAPRCSRGLKSASPEGHEVDTEVVVEAVVEVDTEVVVDWVADVVAEVVVDVVADAVETGVVPEAPGIEIGNNVGRLFPPEKGFQPGPPGRWAAASAVKPSTTAKYFMFFKDWQKTRRASGSNEGKNRYRSIVDRALYIRMRRWSEVRLQCGLRGLSVHLCLQATMN